LRFRNESMIQEEQKKNSKYENKTKKWS